MTVEVTPDHIGSALVYAEQPPYDPEFERVKAVLESRLLGRTDVSSRIGRFVVLERVGAGGMGVVYSAFDPQLDRKVAIKLLFEGVSDERERARLLGEAKAMAKLAHPNVVGVYEVGEHLGQVFLAMEYVRGRTLRSWVTETSRNWRETLAMCVQAGRGLAAAHAAGIVHRDFKPDNVLVGEDERARVLDFGLARQAIDTTREPRPLDAADSGEGATLTRLTQTGAVLGTPAYMSPEQIRGETVDAQADQFGFCIATWEAFAGERPFAGDTVQTLFEHVTAGEVRRPPRAAIPSWLEAVLRRGLSPQRDQRYPSVDALLAALERGATRRRRARIAAAVSIVALSGLGIWGAGEASRRYDRAQAIAGCAAAGASVEEAWNDDTRERVRAALVATGVSYAATTAEKVMPWLDAQATAWQYARTEACLDANVREVWDDDTLDRSLWCLDERRMELEALVGELSRSDATVVQKAVTAAAGLPNVDSCRDAVMLARLPPPPVDRRAEIREVRIELSRVGALSRAGKSREALALARTAREHADELGWPVLVAATRASEARLLDPQGDYEEAQRVGEQAYFEAARVGAWDIAAGAATSLAFVVGDRLARRSEGLAWGGHAEIALAYAGGREDLHGVGRLNSLASVHYRAGDYEQAQTLHERALAIKEQALGPDHPNVAQSLNNLATVHEAKGDYSTARTLHERALAIRKQSLGPDHPDVAQSLANLALLHEATGDYVQARTTYARALTIYETALGPDHPDVAQILANLALVHYFTGEYAEARALNERSLAILETALGPDHPDVATGLGNLALVHYATGDYARARELHERALAVREKTLGPEHPHVATSLANLASVHHATGDYALALTLYERALAVTETALGPEHPEVATVLVNLADEHLSSGDPAQARTLFERAVAIVGKALGPEHPLLARGLSGLAGVEVASGDHEAAVRLLERAVAIYDQDDGEQSGELFARFDLAKELVVTGGDRTRARTLARQARDGWRETADANATDLAEVEEWLRATR